MDDRGAERDTDRSAGTPAAQGTPPRFVVLDTWRGIAACFVAAFHAGPVGHLQHFSLLRQAYYFVDFFFVLSGFVIAANYATRITDPASLGRFLTLRLGRLYPLHFVMLLAFIGLELLKFLPAFQGLTFDRPFSTPQSAPETIVTNLLLVHSLGVHDFYTWNTPSWSISTEFYTYVLFAAALLFLRGRTVWLLLGTVVVAPVSLAVLHGGLAADYDYGLIRCVFGFSAGALAWQLFLAFRRRWGARPLSAAVLSCLEAAVVAVLAVAISMSRDRGVAFALPYLFAFAVILFAFEGGTVSKALKHRWLVLLGVLSYSIYMTHLLVKRLLLKSADLLGHFGAVDLVRETDGVRTIGVAPWQGDLYLLVYLGVVVALSYWTYRLIERPARTWSRSLVLTRERAWRPREGQGAP